MSVLRPARGCIEFHRMDVPPSVHPAEAVLNYNRRGKWLKQRLPACGKAEYFLFGSPLESFAEAWITQAPTFRSSRLEDQLVNGHGGTVWNTNTLEMKCLPLGTWLNYGESVLEIVYDSSDKSGKSVCSQGMVSGTD